MFGGACHVWRGKPCLEGQAMLDSGDAWPNRQCAVDSIVLMWISMAATSEHERMFSCRLIADFTWLLSSVETGPIHNPATHGSTHQTQPTTHPFRFGISADGWQSRWVRRRDVVGLRQCAKLWQRCFGVACKGSCVERELRGTLALTSCVCSCSVSRSCGVLTLPLEMHSAPPASSNALEISCPNPPIEPIPVSADNPTIADRLDFKLLTVFPTAQTLQWPATIVASLCTFVQVYSSLTNGQMRVISTFRGRSTRLLATFVFLRRLISVFQSTRTIHIPLFFRTPTKVFCLQ